MRKARMAEQLTTAEALVLEVLVAHRLLGAGHSTLDRRLWVKPQLEALRGRGLLTWTFDEDANFRVTTTDRLMSTTEAATIAERVRSCVGAPTVATGSGPMVAAAPRLPDRGAGGEPFRP
jgi:hypothetical protein